jgi:hypothetical protein
MMSVFGSNGIAPNAFKLSVISGWKPTHLTFVFSLRTSVLLPPDGTTLTAFTDVADVR